MRRQVNCDPGLLTALVTPSPHHTPDRSRLRWCEGPQVWHWPQATLTTCYFRPPKTL